ncbi:MAG: protein kinase [Aggregatilineales bacterium]
MIGTRVGQYELVEEIGKGGMATVYRAYQPRMERFVAVKVINKAILSDETSMERFTREARLVVKLEHPHLLPVYDYDGRHDPPYIVMRYLESGTLKDVLEQGALPLREAAFMLQQITSALDYAHRQGVIHRDIKPSNIMIDADGNAFLMDFGIARVGDQKEGLTQTGFAVGTPGYMSPEQALGESVDSRTDIYALGVVLFQMITGELPYTSETPMGLVLKHMQEPVPIATERKPDLPDEVNDIIASAMAKQPENRYQTGGDMVEALMDVVGNITSSRGAPTQLRIAAKRALESIQSERDKNSEKLDATMAEFAKIREMGTPGGGVGQMADAPTMMTPTDQQAINPPTLNPSTLPLTDDPNKRQASRNQMMLFGGGILLILMIVVVGLVLAGGDGISDAEATQTQVAFIESFTDTPTSTPSLTSTPEPSATDTPTRTHTPTSTRTNAPPTPRTPIAQAQREMTIRLGPGSNFAEVGTFADGDELDITGVSENGVWYQVLLPDGTRGWILSSQRFVDVTGNPEIIIVADAPTLTPSNTATNTATATDTPTATLTPSLTATDTQTATNTLTATATLTATVTATATETPTATATVTDTPMPSDTPTATEPPTNTPTATATPTATDTLTPTATFTPTPIPPGRFPFGTDFSDDSALTDWTYNPDVWRIATQAGETALRGQGRLSEALTILGDGAPEWAENSDFVMSFDFYMAQGASGLRVVFRYDENTGYNALELFPGLLFLKRENAENPDFLNRDTERTIRRNSSAPIRNDTWHNAVIVADGQNISLYIDRRLILRDVDNLNPRLSSGDILLQVNSVGRSVLVDDLAIVGLNSEVSNTFEQALPENFITQGTVSLAEEDATNSYLTMSRNAELAIEMQPVDDFTLRTRVQVANGRYSLYLRETESESLHLDMQVTGNLVVSHLVDGESVSSFTLDNFFTRNRWQELEVTLVGDRIMLYLDGRERLNRVLASTPSEGRIRFATTGLDLLWLDDLIFTAASPVIAGD